MDKKFEDENREIIEIYNRFKDTLGENADARYVSCACYILIAECNVSIGIMPTEIEEQEKISRPVVLGFMELFRRKVYLAKKLKK